MFDDVVDCHVDGIVSTHQDAFVVSNNVGKIIMETSKGCEIMIQCTGGLVE